MKRTTLPTRFLAFAGLLALVIVVWAVPWGGARPSAGTVAGAPRDRSGQIGTEQAVTEPRAAREVILATQRDHALHVIDAETLEPLGRFVVHNLAHWVGASPDGRRLYLAQAETPDGNNG